MSKDFPGDVVASQAAVSLGTTMLCIDRARNLAVEQERNRIARDIQQGLLPAEAPGVEGYDLAFLNVPCDETGGDYFDYIEMPDGRLAVVVADVVGHGVAAALLMAKLSAEVRFSLATQLAMRGARAAFRW